jgi:hypothetical protein
MAGYAGLSGTKAVLDMAAQIYAITKNFSVDALHVGVPKVLADEIQREIDKRWKMIVG